MIIDILKLCHSSSMKVKTYSVEVDQVMLIF